MSASRSAMTSSATRSEPAFLPLCGERWIVAAPTCCSFVARFRSRWRASWQPALSRATRLPSLRWPTRPRHWLQPIQRPQLRLQNAERFSFVEAKRGYIDQPDDIGCVGTQSGQGARHHADDRRIRGERNISGHATTRQLRGAMALPRSIGHVRTNVFGDT